MMNAQAGKPKQKGVNRLKDKDIQSHIKKALEGKEKPKRYHDGGGLYVNVTASGRASFVFVYTLDSKRTERGLGPYKSSVSPDGISLQDARDKVAELKRGLRQGVEPAKAKEAPPEAPKEPTFGEVALAAIASWESNWRNAKHRQQWRNTLETYAKPIWDRNIETIERQDIVDLLEPIWKEKAETASRVRGRLEAVFSYAQPKIYTGSNPATWAGNLKNHFRDRMKLQRGHHTAMPYEKVPAFYGQLRESASQGARALSFCILTATRSGETRLAVWDEIDLVKGLWTIPEERMKANKEHVVPLSVEAVRILEMTPADRRQGLIFPGTKADRPLSDMTLAAFLKRHKLGVGTGDAFRPYTVHGFRSAFREWATEKTTFLFEIGEMALAHAVGSNVTRAYQRGTALEMRREMMEQWAAFVATGLQAPIT